MHASVCCCAGHKFPPLTFSHTKSKVTNTRFDNNQCPDALNSPRGCHSGAVYVTEGSRLILDKCTFTRNVGKYVSQHKPSASQNLMD